MHFRTSLKESAVFQFSHQMCSVCEVCLYILWLLTWPVPVERAGVVVGVDGARGVTVGLAVHRQVAVPGDGDPLGSSGGVVVDGLAVWVRGQELGEYAAARGPVPLFGSEVFRS